MDGPADDYPCMKALQDWARRMDPARTALALLAVVVALVAAIAVLSDKTHGLTYDGGPWPDERQLLPAAAVAAAMIGFYSPRGAWSGVRRLMAVTVAIAWAASGLGALPQAMRPSCCALSADSGVAHAALAPFGIGALDWVVIAVIVGPMLMLLAASPLPDRLNARWR